MSFLRKQASRLVPAQAGSHSTIGFYFLDSHFRGNDNKRGSLARGEAGCFIRLECYETRNGTVYRVFWTVCVP